MNQKKIVPCVTKTRRAKLLNFFMTIAFLKYIEPKGGLSIVRKQKRSGIHLLIVDQYNIFQLCWVLKINLKYDEKDTKSLLIPVKSIPFDRSRCVLHAK